MLPSLSRCFGSVGTGVLALLLVAGLPDAASAQTLTLSTAAGGVSIGGVNPSWSASTGGVNGLGIGTPASGVSLVTSGVTGGVLYTTPIDLVESTSRNQKLALDVYVSTPFGHPAAVQAFICYPLSVCSSSAAYQSISTSAAVPTAILAGESSAGTYTASLAVFVAKVNGASAFSGLDSVTLMFRTYKSNGNNKVLNDTDTLNLSTNIQAALRLTLASAGGATIGAGSDYALAFGNVNGLGIGPATGLTVIASGTSALYKTPYSIAPTFCGFTSTSGIVKALVSTDFAYPAVLALQDSADNSTYTAISKTAGSPTTLTTSAASGSTLTRYLGLSVNGVNGSGAFTGADNAVVQFTLVVP